MKAEHHLTEDQERSGPAFSPRATGVNSAPSLMMKMLLTQALTTVSLRASRRI